MAGDGHLMVEFPAQIGEILQVTTMTLATCGNHGTPHAAAVYFASDQALALYFFSDPHSLHGQHLAQNQQAAIVISPECHGWQDIHGLQMHGKASLVPQGPEWEAGWRAYCAKFPFVTQLKALVARNALYRFLPTWLRLVDNRQGFGYKQEWELS